MSVQVLEGALAASKSRLGELEQQVEHLTQEQKMAALKEQDLLSRHRLEVAELEEQLLSSRTNSLIASSKIVTENGSAELRKPEIEQMYEQLVQMKVYSCVQKLSLQSSQQSCCINCSTNR